MSLFGWRSFLQQWSRAILESMTEEQLAQLPPEVLESGWLGYPGATEHQLAQVEAQLRMKLPPSYREFLKVTNGWRQTTPFIHKLWSTEGIVPFASRHREWIEAFTARYESAHLSFDPTSDLDGIWAPIDIPDAEYLIYGEEQDCSQLRLEYLRTAIEISDVGESAIYLLNPQVVNEAGEWEAWFFADWLPGADRYRSFQEMMEAEYQNFLELRDAAVEQSSTLEKLASAQEDAVACLRERLEAELTSTLAGESEGWRSLKRLEIELQSRQTRHHREYRALSSVDSTQSSRCWSASEFPLLQSWIARQLAELESQAEVESQVEAEIDPPMAKTDQPVEQVISPETVSSLPNPTPVTSNAVTEEARQVPNLILEIDQLEIRQNACPPAYIQVASSRLKQTAKSIVSDSLISHAPFSVEVAFKLVGQQYSEQACSAMTYTAQFYAQNRMTGQWVVLGETQAIALKSNGYTYKAQLHGRTLEAGVYRLQVFATLHGAGGSLASLELPLLNVA